MKKIQELEITPDWLKKVSSLESGEIGEKGNYQNFEE